MGGRLSYGISVPTYDVETRVRVKASAIKSTSWGNVLGVMDLPRDGFDLRLALEQMCCRAMLLGLPTLSLQFSQHICINAAANLTSNRETRARSTAKVKCMCPCSEHRNWSMFGNETRYVCFKKNCIMVALFRKLPVFSYFRFESIHQAIKASRNSYLQ